MYAVEQRPLVKSKTQLSIVLGGANAMGPTKNRKQAVVDLGSVVRLTLKKFFTQRILLNVGGWNGNVKNTVILTIN
jgi:hypothetical protein